LSELENGAKIYTRLKQRAISSEGKKTEELAPAEDLNNAHEKGDGELMQAMFDESAAIDEACGDGESSSSGGLDDL
jgi:hypothetical protein